MQDTFLQKYTHLLISLVRIETAVSESETGLRRQTEDCYIDPHLLLSRVVLYSGPNLALLLLDRCGKNCPFFALVGRDSHVSMTA